MNKIAINMKNILNISLLSLVVIFLSSCYDDKTSDGFSRLYVSGPTGGSPNGTGTYSLGATEGSITWTIDDTSVASVTSTSGTDAEVSFLKFGTFRITASNGSMEGWLDVAVSEVGAGVTASYHYGMINDGGVDTLFLDFDSPLASTPEIVINGANASDTSAYGGTLFTSAGDDLTALTKKGSTYWALYTGGEGNGQPEGRITKITPDPAYSDTAVDSVYFLLPMVDNAQPNILENNGPVAAVPVTWGSELEYEVVFSEAMRMTMADAADTAVWIHFDYTRKVNGVDKAVEDSVELTSEDMVTWTAHYTVSDSIADLGAIAVSRGLGEWLDIAGNAYVGSPAGDPDNLVVDMAGPTKPVTTASESSTTPTGVGNQRWLTLTAGSADAGIGVDGYFYHIKEAYESDTTATGVHNLGPKSLADFGGEMSTGTEQKLMSTDSARYDIFWIAVDKFGYESDIDSGRLQYNKNGEFSFNVDNTIP